MKLSRWMSLLAITGAMSSAPLFAQDVQELEGGIGMNGSQARSDAPWADQQASLDAVKKLQKELNDKGYNSGPEDGLVGPRTEGALREFQQAEGLDASGEINAETLTALDIDRSEFAAFGIRDDSPDQVSPGAQERPDSGMRDSDSMPRQQDEMPDSSTR